jgi:hypothetical protein
MSANGLRPLVSESQRRPNDLHHPAQRNVGQYSWTANWPVWRWRLFGKEIMRNAEAMDRRAYYEAGVLAG